MSKHVAWVLAVLIGSVFFWGPQFLHAQGQFVCPTAPIGANDSRCASTAFIAGQALNVGSPFTVGNLASQDGLVVTAGSGVTISAAGPDANITTGLGAKGNGQINFYSTGFSPIVQIVGATSGSIQLQPSNTGGHMAVGINGTTAPSITAGCGGTGSTINGSNDINGIITGQTAAATSCTLTFGTAFASTPRCVVSGLSSPLTGGISVTASAIVVNFASTANYVWTYWCPGT